MPADRSALRTALVLGLVLSSGLGAPAVAQGGPDLAVPNAALDVALDALRRDYLWPIDEGAVSDGAVAGAVAALEDPFTEYVPPRQATILNQNRMGAFAGVGAIFRKEEGEPAEVVTVYLDLPAHEAGLIAGDRIVAVDGTDVLELDLAATVERIRGPAGEPVTLRLLRGGSTDPLEIHVGRRTIELPSVTSTVLPENVGYVRIDTFENVRVADDVRDRIGSFEGHGVRALILDLRGNGGGYLFQGIEVADLFLSEGPILFTREKGVTRLAAAADPSATELPLVVLIDGASASASEIVAAAVQDHDRATVVGARSFGKGVGQNLLGLPGGGELRYVTFEWLRPSRESVHETGVEPDVAVEERPAPRAIGSGARAGAEIVLEVDGEIVGRAIAGEEGSFVLEPPADRPKSVARVGEPDLDPETDPALQKALEILRERLAVAPS